MKKLVTSGFTLIEILLVIGIFAVLSAIGGISFFSSFTRTNLGTATDLLKTDLKTTQSNAMFGKTSPGTSSLAWGLKILNNTSYVIFPGDTYSSNSPDNVVSTLPNGITVSSTIPTGVVIFEHGTGEIIGYQTGQDSLTLTGSDLSKTITLNKYGTLLGD